MHLVKGVEYWELAVIKIFIHCSCELSIVLGIELVDYYVYCDIDVFALMLGV